MKFYDLSRSMCEWDRLDEWRAKMRDAIASEETGKISPFHLLSVPGMDASEQRSCADLWAKGRIEASMTERIELALTFCVTQKPKIRLGYMLLRLSRACHVPAAGGIVRSARPGALRGIRLFLRPRRREGHARPPQAVL